MLSVFVLFSTAQLVLIDNDRYVTWTQYRNMFMSIAFGVFFFIYLIVFVKLIVQLKSQFPHFFIKEKRRLYFLGSIIMFSILCRVTTSYVFGLMYLKILKSAQDNTYLYPLMQFVSIFLGLMLPWYAMIYSIRHSIGQKQEINHEARLYSVTRASQALQVQPGTPLDPFHRFENHTATLISAPDVATEFTGDFPNECRSMRHYLETKEKENVDNTIKKQISKKRLNMKSDTEEASEQSARKTKSDVRYKTNESMGGKSAKSTK